MSTELLFDIFLAVATVESACNPAVTGDHGQAVGIVQIHTGVVEDVNRLTKTRILPEQREKVKVSWFLFREYLKHYCKDDPDNVQRMVRTWNGGPLGWLKPSTKRYWERVNEILKNPTALAAARSMVLRELAKEID